MITVLRLRFFIGGGDPTAAAATGVATTTAPAATCEEYCVQGAAGTDQPALGHCCVGTNASDNTPSCAMGCLIGRHTTDLAQCQETCIRAQYGALRGQCEFRSAETGNITLNMCSSCVSGVPGDCRSRFGPTINQTSTCTVQFFEAWAPVRGCDLGDCIQGCLFQHGCPAKRTRTAD